MILFTTSKHLYQRCRKRNTFLLTCTQLLFYRYEIYLLWMCREIKHCLGLLYCCNFHRETHSYFGQQLSLFVTLFTYVSHNVCLKISFQFEAHLSVWSQWHVFDMLKKKTIINNDKVAVIRYVTTCYEHVILCKTLKHVYQGYEKRNVFLLTLIQFLSTDNRSVSLYPHNQSYILQYVKYTK